MSLQRKINLCRRHNNQNHGHHVIDHDTSRSFPNVIYSYQGLRMAKHKWILIFTLPGLGRRRALPLSIGRDFQQCDKLWLCAVCPKGIKYKYFQKERVFPIPSIKAFENSVTVAFWKGLLCESLFQKGATQVMNEAMLWKEEGGRGERGGLDRVGAQEAAAKRLS